MLTLSSLDPLPERLILITRDVGQKRGLARHSGRLHPECIEAGLGDRDRKAVRAQALGLQDVPVARGVPRFGDRSSAQYK
jgi:hypothetical protein